MFKKDFEHKMVRSRKRSRTEEKDWSTIGGGVGQIAQVEMVWTCTAYATMSTSKTSHQLDTLWQMKRGKA